MKGDEFSGIMMSDKEGIVFSSNKKELIIENVKRILNTRIGERPNNLEFGSRVKEFLFMPQIYIQDLMDEIKRSIERWEPRVEVKACTLETTDESIQEDVVSIKLELLIKSSSEILDTEVQV